MKYVMLIYETPPNLESRKDPGHDPYVAAWKAYHKALVAAGAYVSGAPLKDMSAGKPVSSHTAWIVAVYTPCPISV